MKKIISTILIAIFLITGLHQVFAQFDAYGSEINSIDYGSLDSSYSWSSDYNQCQGGSCFGNNSYDYIPPLATPPYVPQSQTYSYGLGSYSNEINNIDYNKLDQNYYWSSGYNGCTGSDCGGAQPITAPPVYNSTGLGSYSNEINNIDYNKLDQNYYWSSDYNGCTGSNCGAQPITAQPITATPVYTPVSTVKNVVYSNTPSVVYATPVYNQTQVYSAAPVYQAQPRITSPSVIYTGGVQTNTVSNMPSVVYTGGGQTNTVSTGQSVVYTSAPTQTVYVCWNQQKVSSMSQCPPQVVQQQVCTNGATNYPTCNQCPTGLIFQNNSCIQQIQCQQNYTAINNVCQPNKKQCQNGSQVLFYEQCTKQCSNGQVVVETANCTKTCPNGSVVSENQNCPVTQVTCSANYHLENGTCVIDTKMCADGNRVNYYEVCTKMCTSGPSAGQRIPETATCPSAPTCADNYSMQNGSCVPNNKQCPNGQSVPFYQTCPAQTQTCWDGSVIPTTSVCPTQYKTCPNGTSVLVTQTCPITTCPSNQHLVNNVCVIDTKQCSSGSVVPYYQVCTKTCPNGTVIEDSQTCPSTQTCPTNYVMQNGACIANTKRCNDGSSVPFYRTCTKVCPTGQTVSETDICPAPPLVIVNHKVVTTMATQVVQTSARCNGVGMIANGVMSTGYFEYGPTQNLGSNTNSASIGNQSSTAFSNLITGLQPNTTYYCRAVMSNANGVYRGEIVSFKTSAESRVYIPTISKPVNVTKVVNNKKVVVSTPVKKQIICQDINGLTDTVDIDKKLVNITIQKNGNVAIGSTINYSIRYNNTSKLTLSNVVMKIKLPAEMEFVNTSIGTYDSLSNTLTISISRLAGSADGSINVSARVKNGAEAGKTAVTNVYVSYDLLDQNGQSIYDEVTAYDIATILGNSNAVNSNSNTNLANQNNNVKSPLNTGVSWLPKTLLEWLAIIILIFILIILGRTLYRNIKGGDSHGH